MTDLGFIKAAAASPKLKVANPEYNITEIISLIQQADAQQSSLVVFPELCITGYTCGDLFGQHLLLEKSLDCLQKLLDCTKETLVAAVVGMPLLVEQKLYNCAVVIQAGRILGVVPKTYIPTTKEFYEKRWFSSGADLGGKLLELKLCGQKVPFGYLLFKCELTDFCLGIEICEDLWAVIPPSSYMSLHGATVIANLSASNDLVSKAAYRQQLVLQQSARCMCGYIYASAGVTESTTDLVFGGHCLLAENGTLLKESPRFSRENVISYADLDLARIAAERQVNKTYVKNYQLDAESRKYQTVEICTRPYKADTNFERYISAYPFIPENPQTRDERCAEIFSIQVAGLAKRMEHTRSSKAVIGISGGLDSTLALLVAAKTYQLLGLSPENILAVTMPGFGTTGTTYNNAMQLMASLQVSIREIDIKPACLQHFKDIGHNPDVHDVTYENVQARERTQVLMDLANKYNGLVVGTGDLSELALGWSTYNGDHMSMYAVNCGVPKTLVQFLVRWVADNMDNEAAKAVLYKIIATPISPELIPPDQNGQISQKTEDYIGPYELHDFFLYYAIRFGLQPRKVLFLAEQAFQQKYDREVLSKWLKTFYRRFFTQQFKRSCLPDGPKVGTISLSPRGDWRMPSDADASLWLAELE